MATPYSVPIEAFFRRVEEDRKFFNYLNLSDQEALDLATNRAKGYMHEACARIMLDCPGKSDFSNYDDETETFGFDMSNQEVLIMSSIMYEMYLDRDIAKLRCMSRDYVPKELRVFDPSNARKTYFELYQKVCDNSEHYLNTYLNTDDSGKWVGIDFAGLDIDTEG